MEIKVGEIELVYEDSGTLHTDILILIHSRDELFITYLLDKIKAVIEASEESGW